LAIFDQYLDAPQKRCKIGTLLPHHTVVWSGYLVYCACAFCLYGYGFLSGEKKGRGVKLRTLVLLLKYSGMSFSHFDELSPMGGSTRSPRSLYTNYLGKNFAAVKTGMRSPYGGICVLLAHLLL